MLTVSHASIYRWGMARIHWKGSEKELDALWAWIEGHIPLTDRRLDELQGVMADHWRTNRSMCFEVGAWTFLCYWWTDQNCPARGEPWKLKKGDPQYGGNTSLLSID